MHNNILILGLGLIMVGFIVFFYGGLKLLKGWQSLHYWATASAVIIESEVVALNPFHNKPEKDKYKVTIKYEFAVADEKYIGNTIRFDEEQKHKSFTQMEYLQCTYPQGKPTVINYNPKDPTDNVLVPGVKIFDLQYPITGLAMIILGILVLMT